LQQARRNLLQATKIDDKEFAEKHLGGDSKKKLPDINDVLDLSSLLHHPGVKQVCDM
jgi:hypothetical protein